MGIEATACAHSADTIRYEERRGKEGERKKWEGREERREKKYKCSAVAEMRDRLATMDMGQ